MSDLPPEPRMRHITPAPEDYATQPASRSLLWPLFWAALAFVLWIVVYGGGWQVFQSL